MLKQITIAVCDICGTTEKAAPALNAQGEYLYYLPENWTVAAGNRCVHMCPTCTEKLTRQPKAVERRSRT